MTTTTMQQLVEYEPVEMREGEANDNYFGDGHHDAGAPQSARLPGVLSFAQKRSVAADAYITNIEHIRDKN